MSNFYKILFYIIIFISSLLSVSSLSWIIMWMGLEINLLCIIPIFLNYKSIYSSESSFKYFIIQALASTLFMFSLMMNENLYEYMFFLFKEMNNLLIMTSLLMKLGMVPFHFWFPEVMEGLSWNNCLLLLTWQKFAPMILISMFIKPSMFLILTIIMSSLIGSLMGFNQTSMRKIMAYSSINHMSWMLFSMFNFNKTWMIYYFLYSLSSIFLVYIFSYYNIFYFNQFSMLKFNIMSKFFIMLNFLSLGGLPPFIGFLPKWLVVYQSILLCNFILPWILMILTLITLGFYMRLNFSSILFKFTNYSMNSTFNLKFLFILFNFIFLFSLILFNIFI